MSTNKAEIASHRAFLSVYLVLVGNLKSSYHVRWFVITSEGIGYFKKNDSFSDTFKEYNPFSENLNVNMRSRNLLKLRYVHRTLDLRAHTAFNYLEFVRSLIRAFAISPANNQNRFDSFCKVTIHNKARFYVCGGEGETHYFTDLFRAIQKAQKEIFITDWLLTPQMYLLRPVDSSNQSRLDLTLLEACKRGVKVYIILYKGVQGITYQESARVKAHFMGLHPNFFVFAHPGWLKRHRDFILESPRKARSHR